MDAKRNDPAAPFAMRRTFDAPRAQVFDAFVSLAAFGEWWGPKGTKLTNLRMDVREGGVTHYALNLPDGGLMWGRAHYRVVTPTTRLVWVNSFSNPAGEVARHPGHEGWPLQILVEVVFEEQGGKTTLSLTSSPLDASEAECATFDEGRASMVGGWSGSFDQLDTYLMGTPR